MTAKNLVLRLRNTFAKVPSTAVLVLILFIINILLASSQILPAYDEINPFDGAKYIESGRQLVDGGELREISRSPTLSLIYAGIYLFVQNSLDWFVLSAGIGNLILYTLLWFATFYFGLRFKDHFSPFILVGVIFVSPAPITILGNPSDAL
jgi:type III secretory pathway component EscU